jgi:hypothetical protein
MKRQIDDLIKQHTSGYQKYILKCSISDFKLLQRLMGSEYSINDYNGLNGMWKHDGLLTFGTVKFDNFELNVIKDSKYMDEFSLVAVDIVDEMFWNSKE